MKPLRVAMTALAWVGLLLLMAGLVGTSFVYVRDLSEPNPYSFMFFYFIGLFIAAPGLVLAMVGGAYAQPRHFSPLFLVIVGLYFIGAILLIIKYAA